MPEIQFTDSETTNEAAPQQDPQVPGADDGRPDWLPSKFGSPEDLAKAYGELERKLGEGGGTPDGGTDDPAPAAPAGEEEPAQSTEEVEQPAGLSDEDFSRFGQELAANGTLSEETYAELATAGYSQQMVDTYIAGQQAIGEANVEAAAAAIGGMEAYKKLIEWAPGNLSEGEINAFNATLMDRGRLTLEVQKLYAKYQSAVPGAGLITGDEAPNPNGGPFNDMSEMLTAMSDPRYAESEHFRKQVEQRAAMSSF